MILIVRLGGDACGPVNSYDQIAEQFERSFNKKHQTEFNDIIQFKDITDKLELEIAMKREHVDETPCTIILDEFGYQLGKYNGRISKTQLCDMLTAVYNKIYN